MNDERGFTLIEVLVSSLLLIVVLGATLTTLDSFTLRSRDVTERTDAIDKARTQIDRLTRELRNLASPTFQAPNAVDRMDPYDIIFQSVDPTGPAAALNGANVRRVRYCLNRSDPQRGVMWFMTQTWSDAPPPSPTTTACGAGAAGWQNHQAIAHFLVNGFENKPVFTFDSAEPKEVRQIGIELHVDTDPGRGTKATDLKSGVYLRNQNRAPTAVFSVIRAGGRTLMLNGSASTDPEHEPLEYQWFDGATKVGEGSTLSYDVPGSGYSSRAISLKVYDPAKLEGAAPVQEVAVP